MRLVRLQSVLFLAALTITACNGASTGGDTGSSDTDSPTTTSDTTTDTTTPTTTTTQTSGIPELNGHLAGFDIRHVKEQGYWYSRYNLASLVTQSGNGMMFMPDMALMAASIGMVSDDVSTAMAPVNPAMLQRLYTVGNPSLVTADDGNMMDFIDGRWEAPVSNNATGESSGWTLLKEVEWAKQFHVDAHFGSPGDGQGIPGAQERFRGMVMFMSASMQANEWMMNPTAFDALDATGTYVMMQALADLSSVTTAMALPNSVDNRYRMAAGMMAPTMGMADADAMGMAFMMGADGLFMADPAVTTVEEHAIAIQSLTWYASIGMTNRAAAVTRLTTFSDALLAMNASTAVDHAFAIRGLIESERAIGGGTYLAKATEHFEALEADFDWASGTFAGQNTYTPEDVAVILGALNATLIHGDQSLTTVVPMMEHFHEGVVNIGGLQVSAPSYASVMPYEQFSDALFHRYPGQPEPTAAGGANGLGIAPVFARSVTYSGGSWTVDDTSFDTAGAMHLSNEMLWMHVDEVDGFPVIP